MDFRVLGPLDVGGDRGTLELGGVKQRSVLAMLLLHANEVVSSDRLIDALWGASPPLRAGKTIQVYVSRLRKALPDDRLVTRAPGYVLYLDHGELDLARFERLVAEAREAPLATASSKLSEALALWRGPPLADLAYEQFAQAEIVRLEEMRLTVLEQRLDGDLALGRHAELVSELETLVAKHPLREHLRYQLRLALYRSDRQADALAAPPQRPRLGSRLPAPATPLVNRRIETAAVTALLREDARLVTLTGPGGTGKTRLALAVAEELAPTFRDGAVFVDLAPLSDPELLMPTIADTLGVADDTPLAEELHDRSLLLVLDNLEQLLDGVAAIGRLLAGAPRLRILATSRAALQLYGEHEYPVPPLDLPPADASFEALAANDAVRLFASRARAAASSFALDDDTIGVVAAVCRRLDGLPLAIELAAARAKVLPVESILEHLDESIDILSGGARDVPERQRALRATLDWSFHALSPAEQEVFRALGVFSGGFTEALAQAVAGDPVPLAERSLVRRVDDRLTLLEPIRAYAVERLRESGVEDDMRERHLRVILEYAEAANERIVSGTDVETAYDLLGAEYDNVRAALDWAAATGRIEEEIRLAVAMRQFWLIRGHVGEGRNHFDRAIAHAPDHARAPALAHGGTFAYRQGDLATAKAWWAEALELYRTLDVPAEVGRCLGELGSVALGEGDIDRAQALYEESVELFERENVPLRLGVVLANLGAIATMRGELDSAAAHAERAAALQRETRDADGLSVTLHNFARILMALGRLDEGRAALRESIELARSIDYQEVLAYGLETSGELAFGGGEHEQAARLLGAAVAAFDRLGVVMAPEEAEGYARVMVTLRDKLDVDVLEDLHAAGRAASFEESVSSALESLAA